MTLISITRKNSILIFFAKKTRKKFSREPKQTKVDIFFLSHGKLWFLLEPNSSTNAQKWRNFFEEKLIFQKFFRKKRNEPKQIGLQPKSSIW